MNKQFEPFRHINCLNKTAETRPVCLTQVPSHSGIQGNEQADSSPAC